jgi:hypothetical protein
VPRARSKKCVVCGRTNDNTIHDGLKTNRVIRKDGNKSNNKESNLVSVCKLHYDQVLAEIQAGRLKPVKPKAEKPVEGIRVVKAATGLYKVVGRCPRSDIRAVEKAVIQWGQRERFERLV